MSEHPLVKLARKTIETYVKEGKTIEVPADLSGEMKQKAGVFVSIHRKGQLRGCIGTFRPTTQSVAEEIIRNAIEAGTRDPRFNSIQADELNDLEIKVDVLADPVPVKSIKELDAKKYGVIVVAGAKRGLLLPDLPGVNTPDEQIEICRKKAWINDDEPIKLFRFEVRRYS